MEILELLMALEDEGFPFICVCEGDIVIAGNYPQLPPDLAHQLRLNKPELLTYLKKYTRRQLEEMRLRACADY